KAASIYKLPVAPHHRDSMLGHESHEGCSVFIGQDTRNSEQCVGSLSDHRDDGALELRRFSYFKRLQRQAKGRSRILKVLQYQYISSVRGIVENRYARSLRNNYLHELQSLPPQFGADACQPCDVPTWSSEVGDEPGADRISNGRDDDRNRAGGLLDGHRYCRRWGDNDIRLGTDQFGRKLGQSLDLSARESVLDGNVLPFDVPELLQSLPEGANFRRGPGRTVMEKPDPGNLRLARPLRLGGERRGEHGSEASDEGTTIHSSGFPGGGMLALAESVSKVPNGGVSAIRRIE